MGQGEAGLRALAEKESKRRRATHDKEKPQHECMPEAPRADSEEKPQDDGTRRRCGLHDKKLVEVKAEHAEAKAEKSLTPRRQASDRPTQDPVGFATGRADKAGTTMVFKGGRS